MLCPLAQSETRWFLQRLLVSVLFSRLCSENSWSHCYCHFFFSVMMFLVLHWDFVHNEDGWKQKCSSVHIYTYPDLISRLITATLYCSVVFSQFKPWLYIYIHIAAPRPRRRVDHEELGTTHHPCDRWTLCSTSMIHQQRSAARLLFCCSQHACDSLASLSLCCSLILFTYQLRTFSLYVCVSYCRHAGEALISHPD